MYTIFIVDGSSPLATYIRFFNTDIISYACAITSPMYLITIMIFSTRESSIWCDNSVWIALIIHHKRHTLSWIRRHENAKLMLHNSYMYINSSQTQKKPREKVHY